MKLGIQFFGIETSEDTREKMKRAFGFDEPPVTEKLKRADFGSDEEYFDAAAPRLTLPLGRFPSSRLAQPWPPTPRS